MNLNYIFRIFCLVCFILGIGTPVFSQLETTSKGRLKTNVEALNKLKLQEEQRLKQVKARAKSMNIDTISLVGFDTNGLPSYNEPHNSVAANTISTTLARNTFGLTGGGMTIGMWEPQTGDDGDQWGLPLHTHVEYGGRVTNHDIIPANYVPSNHASHVMGTLLADGSLTAGASRGMAYEAKGDAYDDNNDVAEMTAWAMDNIEGKGLVSNHSYGIPGGWRREKDGGTTYDKYTWLGGANTFNKDGDDLQFGYYTPGANSIDQMTYNAPYYLVVKSAGNQRNDNPKEDFFGDDEVRFKIGPDIYSDYVDYDEDLHPKGDGSQNSQITDWGNAKNVLTVGAIDPNSVLTDFSSTGITDDGRIKPDIVGMGFELFSTWGTGNATFDEASGTSMSAPNVAGSALLLQEAYSDEFGSDIYMRSATLKALIFNTAVDLGFPGPDFLTGWGRMNTYKAADLIKNAAYFNASSGAYIIEDVLSSTNLADTIIIHVKNSSSSSDYLDLTIVWTEKGGHVGGDVTAPELRNDLDLRLQNVSNNTEYLPQKPNDFFGGTADDRLNNAEKIRRARFNKGDQTYRVIVRHKTGNFYQGLPQHYSLVLSGVDRDCHHDINHNMAFVKDATYAAKRSIISSSVVKNNENVIYSAKEKMVLKPGFKADASNGSTFKTNFVGCTF